MSSWRELKNNPRLQEIYRIRFRTIKMIREFFWSQGYYETDTPVAIRYPGQEPYLNPISIKLHDPDGQEQKFYLQTSPEFAMKKLLAAGFDKIFQICKCFRDYEEFGGLHNTEFTMVEWYRAPGQLEEIEQDTEKLFRTIAKELGRQIISYKGHKIDLMSQWEKVSLKELWKKYSGVDLDNYLQTACMRELTKKKGYKVMFNDSFEDLFYKIFLNEIEPNLGWPRPIFVYDYPAKMCSLSRRCEDNPKYAERFELYIGGLELANAFGELTEANEQQKKLEADRQKRKQLGKETYPVDPEFIQALHSGIATGLSVEIPRNGTAAGIAIGVDRMVLLLSEANDINEVIFQSISDQQ